MFMSIFQDGVEILKQRWLRMAAATIVATALLLAVCAAIVIPFGADALNQLKDTAEGSIAQAPGLTTTGGDSGVPPGQVQFDPATGQPLPADDLGGVTADPTAGAEDAAEKAAEAQLLVVFMGLLSELLVVLVVLALVLTIVGPAMLLAIVRAAGADEGFMRHFREGFGRMPKFLWQYGVLTAPFFGGAVLIGLLSNFVAPAALLLFLPLGIAFALVGAPMMWMCIVQCALGTPTWTPRTSWQLFRVNTGTLVLLGLALAVIAMLGNVVMQLLPMLFLIPIAVQLFSIAVWIAAWRANGGDASTPEPFAAVGPDAGTASQGHLAHTTAPATAQPAALAEPVVHLQPTATTQAVTLHEQQVAQAVPAPVEALLREGVLAPGTPFGEWLMVGSEPVTFQLTWSEGPAMSVQVADQAGQWKAAGAFEAPTFSTVLQLDAGWQYLHLSGASAQPQAYRLAIWNAVAAPAAQQQQVA